MPGAVRGGRDYSGRRRVAGRQDDRAVDRPGGDLAGILGGMLWAAIVALLLRPLQCSEILVSLMLVYVADLVLSYLVYGPWKDPNGYNFPQTKTFERSRRFHG